MPAKYDRAKYTIYLETARGRLLKLSENAVVKGSLLGIQRVAEIGLFPMGEIVEVLGVTPPMFARIIGKLQDKS